MESLMCPKFNKLHVPYQPKEISHHLEDVFRFVLKRVPIRERISNRRNIFSKQLCFKKGGKSRVSLRCFYILSPH